jgi:hypothetical protein
MKPDSPSPEEILRRYGQYLRRDEEKLGNISDAEFAKIRRRVEELRASADAGGRASEEERSWWFDRRFLLTCGAAVAALVVAFLVFSPGRDEFPLRLAFVDTSGTRNADGTPTLPSPSPLAALVPSPPVFGLDLTSGGIRLPLTDSSILTGSLQRATDDPGVNRLAETGREFYRVTLEGRSRQGLVLTATGILTVRPVSTNLPPNRLRREDIASATITLQLEAPLQTAAPIRGSYSAVP